MKDKLAENVTDFISKCAYEVGKNAEMAFDQHIFCDCREMKMESPIEQILYCSVETILEMNSIHRAEPIDINGKIIVHGFSIIPQKTVGRYRADFLMSYSNLYHREPKPARELIVECDSQKFHERSEKERRYEKARDRFFTLKGCTVFHFTGSEIVKEPFRVAREIVGYLTGEDPKNLISSVDDL